MKLIILIILINFLNITSANYFENSILNALKNKNGRFESVFEFKYMDKDTGKLLSTDKCKESYDFNFKNGKLIQTDIKFNYERNLIYQHHENGVEIYDIYHKLVRNRSTCFNGKTKFETILEWTTSNLTYNSNSNYSILGPNILLEIFIEMYNKNKENVNCKDIDNENLSKPKKCSIILKDKHEYSKDVCIEYYLSTKLDYTLYPNKISVSRKNKAKEWIVVREMNYLKFEPLFNQNETIFKLPIGFGCQRPNEFSKYYPQIKTNTGKQFKFNYTVQFTYLDSRIKSNQNNYLTRSYSNKAFIDMNNLIFIEDTINELTNRSIRSIYNIKKLILHHIDLDHDKCVNYEFKLNHTLNYFYVQHVYLNKMELFYTKNNYTYIGDKKINNVNCLVFEKLIDETNQIKKTNAAIIQNKNEVFPVFFIVNHYYPNQTDYWGDENYKLPIRIEIQLLKHRFGHLGNLTIDIKYFEANFENVPKYDTSKCTDIIN